MSKPLAALRRRMQRLCSSKVDLLSRMRTFLRHRKHHNLDREEFEELLEQLGVQSSGHAVNHAFDQMDENVDGTISIEEFCDLIFPAHLAKATSLQRTLDPGPERAMKRASRLENAAMKRAMITDPQQLLAQLQRKITRNVSGVAKAYRHFRSLATHTASNEIDINGFRSALKRLQLRATPAAVDALFRQLDPNHSGTLDLNEFIKGILSAAGDNELLSQPISSSSAAALASGLLVRRNNADGARGGGVPSHAKRAPQQRRPLMTQERLAQYIVQIRDKFNQHGGQGGRMMINAWKKLRVFANARVPSKVTFSEFDRGLKAMGVPLPNKVVAAVFAAIDLDGSGTLDFKEFVRYVFPDDKGRNESQAADWQKLGAEARAAKLAKRMDKTNGLIREPIILHETIKRRIIDSGKPAADVFRKFRSASTRTGPNDDEHVITCTSFKRALVKMEIQATAACVETLFRFMDVDLSGSLDYCEFVDAIMMTESEARDLAKREAVTDLDSKVNVMDMRDIEGHHNWVQARMADQLQRRIEQAKATDVSDFMRQMRDSLNDADGPTTARHLGTRTRTRATNNRSRRSNARGPESVSRGGHLNFGVVGHSATSAARAAREPLPQIGASPDVLARRLARSKVSKKAAASAIRAQRLIRDRDPKAAFAVAQASLAPQYARSSSVLSTFKPPRV